MAKRYKRTILLGISDKHGGHKLGLCNPETVLKEEDENGNFQLFNPPINPVQQYLWALYIKHLEEVKYLAGKDDVVAFDLGDPTQGGKYMSEVMYFVPSYQFKIGYANMLPVYQMFPTLKAVRLTKGTASHEYEGGTSTETIEDRLRDNFPKIDTKSLYHGLAFVDGLPIDYSHHGPPPGSRNWLKGNVARLYLSSMIEDCLNAGITVPKLVMRGHYHVFVKEFYHKRQNGSEINTWLTINPSYAFPDEWTRQTVKSVFIVSTGLLAYEIINGKIYDIHAFVKTKDRRTEEVIIK